ncbi:MAG: FAD-dependent oxidoreductase [Desulfopila sp.]|jgi:NADH dehydrogenase FAD-containing subunit|nr:FAD-dependent oxidoreductase [Desulfopila sp.]
MSKHLVLAGGGHAHMMVLANIEKIIAEGHQVTVIQPSDHHYYSGMGPGMLSTHYSPDDIRFRTRFVVERQGGRFIKARVVGIEAKENRVVLDSGEKISYEVLSCNVGSSVPFDAVTGNRDAIFSAKPIERLMEAQQKIISLKQKESTAIAIVGGGPAAVEIAGNASQLAHRNGCRNIDIRLFAGRKMMADFSRAIEKIIRRNFKERGITINESGYVDKVADNTVVLADGSEFKADVIFLATGVKPSPIFADSGMTTGPDGGLVVNTFLQSPEYSNIFGGGDCIYYSAKPLDKVGVYAVRQNPVLLHNISACLNGTQMEEFDPGGNYLLIFNLGDGFGALQKGPFVWGGKLSFSVKDYIDKKFMQRFQALED